MEGIKNMMLFKLWLSLDLKTKVEVCEVCLGDGIAANETGWCKCESCKGTGTK